MERLTGPVGTPLKKIYTDPRTNMPYRIVYDPERQTVLKQPMAEAGESSR